MNEVDTLYRQIVADLLHAGRDSPYSADANEPDPRYKSYGVRADGKKKIFAVHRPAIRALDENQQISLAKWLIESRVGEQQSIGLWILEPLAPFFSPDRFDELDRLIRCLHGWSKIDSVTGILLRDILLAHPAATLNLVRTWNEDPDMWLRRTSVVLFTRKIAKTGRFTDFALEMCHNLIHDREILVQKGVGWALKDLMVADKKRILGVVAELRHNGVSSVITLYAIKNLKGQERAAFLAK